MNRSRFCILLNTVVFVQIAYTGAAFNNPGHCSGDVMKRVVITFLLLLLLCGRAYAANYAKIELRDIQGMFGGQELTFKSNGEILTRIVKPFKNRLYEKRYSGRLNFPETVADLDLPQLEHYQETVREGMPDESRPTIRVAMKNGDERVYSKWAEESEEHFDRVYKRLLKLVRSKTGRLVYSGYWSGPSK